MPNAGDEFRVAPDEKTAKTVAEAREQRARLRNQRGDARVQKGVKLEDIFDQIQKGEVATLNLVLKADVQGSLEALTESLRKLERRRREARPSCTGPSVASPRTTSRLAAATNATIIGFNVRPDRKARELAETEDVEIRTYEIIYQILEDIERAMVGLLAPEFEEVVTGEAEVREIFRVPRIGAIAGCYVRSGTITRGSKVRFLRDGVIIWKGAIQSLKRFKDDAREVREGFECGIGLSRLPGPEAGRPHRDLRGARDRPHLIRPVGRGGSPTIARSAVAPVSRPGARGRSVVPRRAQRRPRQVAHRPRRRRPRPPGPRRTVGAGTGARWSQPPRTSAPTPTTTRGIEGRRRARCSRGRGPTWPRSSAAVARVAPHIGQSSPVMARNGHGRNAWPWPGRSTSR